MDPAVQQVFGLLLRSRLLTADEVKTLYQRWVAEANHTVRDGERLAKWLVANGQLTEYQATLLARGHTEGFFLGEYKILERLGRGRMAGVYKAIHRRGEVVAIKVLPPSKAKDPALLERFQREARLALRLNHPNVVRALHVAVDGEHHYLVMEYLEGETLEEVLKRRVRLAPLEAVRLIHQALFGLQHLQEQGLVHRDLKPGNLMLVPAPNGPLVKILDIGLGRELAFATSAAAEEESPLTAAGVLLGTPDYMAPEQAREARTVDIRADLYSLGCILYHAIAGQPPFPDSNFINQMVRHATETPRPLRELAPMVPEGLQRILDALLAKDPAQRYATPNQVGQALRTLLDSRTTPAVTQAAAQPGNTTLEPEAQATALREQPGTEAPESPESSPAVKRSTKADRRRRAAPRADPVPALRRAAEETSDVDLVAIPPQYLGAGWQLSRRDLVMLALGGGSVLFAVFLGWLLAQLFRKKESVPLAPDRPEGDRDKES